jgi:subtilisin family serine protease
MIRIASRSAALAGAFIAGLATGSDAASAPMVSPKIDPRLLASAAVADAPVPVWVRFADKGESGPADLAARLARAELGLVPRTRARRVRAHVRPLVDYRDLPVHAPYLEALHRLGYSTYGVSRWFNHATVRTRADRLGELASLPFVKRLEPVELAQRERPPAPADASPVAPDDAFGLEGVSYVYGQNSGPVLQLNMAAVHDSGYIGTGVLVALFDEGFNYHNKHEALRMHSVPTGRRRDFVEGDTSVQDTLQSFGFQHGTWVMGCVAGNKDGTYVGTAPGATFALARTENSFSETPVEMTNWAMAVEWADSIGVDLVSSSLGYATFDNAADNYVYADMNGHTTIVTRAAQIAASKGILVVTAQGNQGTGSWHYLTAPADASGDSIIAVGAVDVNGVVAAFSGYGPTFDGRVKPDLSARGVSNPVVDTTGDPQDYNFLSGTSFATPLVAGVAACLLQARPSWTPSLVLQALRETASRFTTPDDRIGYGIPDALAALRWTPDTVGGPPPGSPPGVLGIALQGANPARLAEAPVRVRVALGAAGPAAAPARVRVIDVQGRLVTTAFSGVLQRGAWTDVVWNGLDADGRPVDPGLFLLSLEAAGRRATVRVAALR